MISLRDSPIYRQKSFDESKHPRDEGGKFGEGGGGSKPENKLPKEKKPKGPKPDDVVHGYLAAFNDPTDKATAEDARTANKELKEEGSKYRIIPDEENRGKWKIAHVKWLNDEISEDWTVGVNALTGNIELADRNYLKEMQAISGDKISRGYLAAFNDPNEAVTEEDAATANEEMAADGSKFQIAYDKDYGLWVARPREEKSSTRWVKSKDASGHEHSSETGQFTSGGGGTGNADQLYHEKPNGSGEGTLYQTRKGAGEASEETKKIAADTLARADKDMGATYIDGEAALKKAADESEPATAHVGAMARDIMRANTTKADDVVPRFKPKTGSLTIWQAGHNWQIVGSIEAHDRGTVFSGKRRKVLIPHDATDEQAATLIHKANGYKLPPSLESGKPANNLPK